MKEMFSSNTEHNQNIFTIIIWKKHKAHDFKQFYSSNFELQSN